MSQDVALKCRVRLATPWQSEFGQITSSTMFLLGLCYFKKYFLSCGIEPLHEQSLSRRSLILSTNLPARRLSVCLQTRFYWTLLWNGWVITLSYIFHVSFFSVLISPLKTSHMKGWTNQHRFFKIYKPKQNTVDSLFWYLQHSLKYM